MEYPIIVVLAFIPGILWLLYFYAKDRLEPEPRKFVTKIFFLGMLATIPAALIESPLNDGILLVVIVAPIVEELAKFSVVRWGAYKDARFNEPMDGIIYAVSAALGFASLENVFYLFNSYSQYEVSRSGNILGSFLATFLIRALLSVPSHAINSAMWGYALGMAKFADEKHGKSLVRKGILLGMFCHAIFNLLATQGLLGILAIYVVPAMWHTLNHKIKEAIISSPFASEELRKALITGQKESSPDADVEYECSECGTPVRKEDKVCPKCGGSLEETIVTEPEAESKPGTTSKKTAPDSKVEVIKEYECSECGTSVKEDDRVCPKCGVSLEELIKSDKAAQVQGNANPPHRVDEEPCCMNCGVPVDKGNRLCAVCAARLSA